MGMNYCLVGIIVYIIIVSCLWLVRPSSRIHSLSLGAIDHTKERWITMGWMSLVILLCILPMSLSPIWNGEIADYRDQYERISECFLKGQLYFDEVVDERLLNMENPYDRSARLELNIDDLYWDHAYYRGHLYMYFGVVPAVTLFVPYRIITGHNLITYHATQCYVALFIIGLFLLCRLLLKLFFPAFPSVVFYSMITVASVASVLYAIATPAMYCTAQTAALCFMVWSIYYFVRSVYVEPTERQAIAKAFVGSLFGALAFGCRPTVALANLWAIPLGFFFLKRFGFSLNQLLALCVVLLPYLFVGLALMWYNYARFENPFEFGQSYQLTIADQTSYTNWFSRLRLDTFGDTLNYCLFRVPMDLYPLGFGAFVSYPIFLLSLFLLVNRTTVGHLVQNRIWGFTLVGCGLIFFIPMAIAMFSPFPLPRYRMDYLWIMSIVSIIVVGAEFQHCRHRRYLSSLVAVLCLFSFLFCLRQFFYPADYNFAKYYENIVPQVIHQIFFPWSGLFAHL